MLVVLALLAGTVVGALVLLLAGPPLAAVAVIVMVAAGIAAQRTSGPPRRLIGLTLLVALLAGGGFLALTALDLIDAVTTTTGEVEQADAVQLAAAEDKLEGLDPAASFRLELTEPQLQAVIQDGIAASGDLPIRRLDLDLRSPATSGIPTGDVAFTTTFKSGDVQASGSAVVTTTADGVALELGDLDFGPVRVPALASDAVQEVVGAVTDLNAALADQQTVVQSIEITDDLLVVVGVRAGQALTGGELLAAIRAQAELATGAVVAPPEVLGPGSVDGRQAPGDPVVLALGDSLAAGVGVDRQADGYVSRFHRAVSERDGVPYGLENLWETGATSTSLVTGQQLAQAEAILATRPASYITLNIGANDLLGHLESDDCGVDLASPGCQDRVNRSLATYRTNLTVILDRLVAARGAAQVVFLQIYDPFSLGLGGSDLAAESSAIISRLNGIAAELADARGIVVADGFTPLQNTTAATTHMLDAVPDIHPNAAGYDVLASALVQATQ